MEATGNIGVGLKRFSGMKQALGSFYKKIVIRHLEWERPDGALEKLEQFVNEVQGAQYQFKISQLAKRQTVNFDSTKYKSHEESKNQTREASNSEVQRQLRLTEEGRGYFCSELVVKAFKVCGILAEELKEEASSNFLPGDLASEKDLLKLIPEAKLGREQLIFSGGMYNAEED